VALLICLAVVLAGIIPIALAGEFSGAWRIALPGMPRLQTASVPSPAPDFALPREAWVAAPVDVRAIADGTAIATLQPGFPVTLTAHQMRGTTSWSHIRWSGPTSASGGAGWVPDSALLSFGGRSRAIGDIGALAPALRERLGGSLSALDLALYFPTTGQLYLENSDRSFALGDGARAALLVADAAQREAHPAPSTPASAPPDPAALYTRLGGASGAAAQLSALNLSGVQFPSGNWQDARATASAMLRLYDGLDAGTLLNARDRGAVLAELGKANVPALDAAFAPATPAPGSLLLAGTWQAGTGWTASAYGILHPAKGPRVVFAAALQGQPSAGAAQQALANILRQIGAVAATGDA
jgi:hypothetical protein